MTPDRLSAPRGAAVVLSLGDDPYVLVDGDVDLATVPMVEDAIRSAIDEATSLVHVDLSGVSFLMASGGVHTLVRMRTHADRQGCDLRYERPSRVVERVLRLTGTWWLVAGTSPPPDVPGFSVGPPA